jgi:hypothetical protein
MEQEYLEILPEKQVYQVKFLDIICLLIDQKNRIRSFHGVILLKKIIVSYWLILVIYAIEH